MSVKILKDILSRMRNSGSDANTVQAFADALKNVSDSGDSHLSGTDLAARKAEQDLLIEQIRLEKKLAEEKNNLNAATRQNRLLLQEMQTAGKLGLRQLQEEIDALNQKLILKIRSGEASEEELTTDKELMATKQEKIELLREEIELLAEQRRALDDTRDGMSNLLNTLTFGLTNSKNWKRSLMGSISVTKDLAASTNEVVSAIKTGVTFQNISANALMAIQEATIAYAVATERSLSRLEAATGATGVYREMLLDTAATQRSFGLVVSEVGEAVGQLFNTFKGFSDLIEADRIKITETATSLMGLGISSATSSKLVAGLGDTMGMSALDIESASHRIIAASNQIGESFQYMADSFVSAMDHLAVFGDEAVPIFLDMAAAAKVAGVGVSDLHSAFGETLDTFAGASKITAGLNAVLETSFFDETTMVNLQNPAERYMYVLKGLQQSTIDFANADVNTKRMISNAAGFRNASVGVRLLETSLSDVQAKMDQLRTPSGQLKDLAEQAMKTKSVFELFKVAFESLAIVAQPLIDNVLRPLVVWFIGFTDSLAGAITAGILIAIPVIKLLAVTFSVLKSPVLWLATGLRTLIAPLAGVAATGPTFATWISTIGAAARSGAVGLLILSGVMLAISASVSAIILSMAVYERAQAKTISATAKLATALKDVAKSDFAVLQLQLERMVETMNKLPQDKIMTFKMLTDSVTRMSTATAAIDATQAEAATGLVEAGTKYVVAQAASGNNNNMLAAVLKELTNLAKASAGPGQPAGNTTAAAQNLVVEKLHIQLGTESLATLENVVANVINNNGIHMGTG